MDFLFVRVFVLSLLSFISIISQFSLSLCPWIFFFQNRESESSDSISSTEVSLTHKNSKKIKISREEILEQRERERLEIFVLPECLYSPSWSLSSASSLNYLSLCPMSFFFKTVRVTVTVSHPQQRFHSHTQKFKKKSFGVEILRRERD